MACALVGSWSAVVAANGMPTSSMKETSGMTIRFRGISGSGIGVQGEASTIGSRSSSKSLALISFVTLA
eukprot:5282635-Alexandrium_andersonii.AAC.1